MNTHSNLIEIATNDSVDYRILINAIAETVQHIEGANTLANDVFETVCGLPDEVLDACVAKFDPEQECTGHCNDSWAQNNTPDFDDYSALGDWESYDMESLQKFMQDVLNAYVRRNPVDDN